mmetsp:Transcript_96988/g.313161  ORF Transcript_96988/g.313161 Transcript_96988/m.313161 type:complete len:245 (+) Transcript_96988:299-1033(+)
MPTNCSIVWPGNERAPWTRLTSKSEVLRESRKTARSLSRSSLADSGETQSRSSSTPPAATKLCLSTSKRPIFSYLCSISRNAFSISSTVACCHQRSPSSARPPGPPARCLARRKAKRCSVGSDSFCMAPKSFLKADSASGCGFLSGWTSRDSCLYCFRILPRSSSRLSGSSSASNSSAAPLTHSTASSGDSGAVGSLRLCALDLPEAAEIPCCCSSAPQGSRFSARKSLLSAPSLTCQRPLSAS